MAMNLRLPEATEAALKLRSSESGRSQQELVREALDQYLGLVRPVVSSVDSLVANGVVRPPTPYRRVIPRIALPEGMTSLDLLDRDDRF